MRAKQPTKQPEVLEVQSSQPAWFKKVIHLYRSSRPVVRYSAWSLSVAAIVAIAYLILILTYFNKVYPNIYLGGQNFAGLNQIAAEAEVDDLADKLADTAITLTINNHTQEIKPKDISWLIDKTATTASIYNYGRSETNRWHSLYQQLLAPLRRVNVEPTVSYDHAQLDAIVAGFAETVGTPAQDASAELVNDKLVISAEKSGQVVDQPTAKNVIVSGLKKFSSQMINLNLVTDQPTIFLGNEDQLKEEVETLSKVELRLKWSFGSAQDKPTGSKTLSRKDVRQLIDFIGHPAAEPTAKQVLSADFTTTSIGNYLTSIASQTDSPAVEPKLAIKDGKVVIANNSKEGSVVDIKTSSDAILMALENRSTDPVELTMKTQQPVINQAGIDSLGIKDRIGFGETSMGNSPTNRRHNIANGVSLLSSALVKPGDEFSTVKTLGAVDNTTGFLPELVIKSDQSGTHTGPEFGGGLCQVSTTLFRAVMNAGLPVTARQNHSYRVSYYEPPIGLDATIYLPAPDFKFKNDTPGYILVQARVVGNKVQFELWGTGDGRSSTISDPVVSNIIDPPPAIYTNTDTLGVGVTKQTDHSHIGATAVAVYTVMRGGQVINKQTFKSVYKALPERFLVGTNPNLLTQ